MTAFSVPQAWISEASHLTVDSPVLQSYSLTTAVPLQHPLDAADLTDLLILGQNMSSWDHGT